MLFAAGWSLLLLALFYWIIDVRGRRGWAFPFVVIGMNPITIYLAQDLFDFGIVALIVTHGFIHQLGPYAAGLPGVHGDRDEVAVPLLPLPAADLPEGVTTIPSPADGAMEVDSGPRRSRVLAPTGVTSTVAGHHARHASGAAARGADR